MCGLFCIISKTKNGFIDKELKLFTEGLFTDTVRGKDSTGVFYVTEKGNAHLLKDNTSGYEFTKTKDYDDFLSDCFQNGKILVGHNRSATLGNISDKNAHPFISGNTVLVHNGTLYNHKALANTDTDSEAIAQLLDKKPHTEVLSELNGAFALIWYNAKEKKLYVSRNNERPLWIITTTNFDLIGSEPKHLEWILNRNTNIDKEACYFATYCVYSWDLNSLESSYTETINYEKKKTPILYTFPISKKPDTSSFEEPLHKTIEITTTLIEVIENKLIISGTHPKYTGKTFVTTLYNKSEDDIRKLNEKITLNVRPYYKINADTFNCTLELPNLILKDIYNVEHNIQPHSYCTKCNAKITKEHDGKIWVRVKQNQVKTTLCPNCVSKNPNLLK